MAHRFCFLTSGTAPYDMPPVPAELAPFVLAIVPSTAAHVTPDGLVRKYGPTIRFADMSAAVQNARGDYQPYSPLNLRRGVF